jgi:hypothetical protein
MDSIRIHQNGLEEDGRTWLLDGNPKGLTGRKDYG